MLLALKSNALLGITFLLVCYACSINKQDEKDLHYWHPVDGGEIEVPIDSFQAYYWRYFEFIETGYAKEIVSQDFTKGAATLLHFYDHTSGNKRSITLEKEGPSGISYPMGFYFKARDSIYIPAPYEYKIYLVNNKAEVLSLINTSAEGMIAGYTALMYPRSFNRIGRIGNKLIVPSIPDFDLSNGIYSNILGFAVIADMETGSTQTIIPFSKAYKDFEYWSTQQVLATVTCNTRHNYLIVNYPIDPTVYIYKLTGELIKEIDLPSALITVPILPSRKPLDSTVDDLKFGYSSDSYFSFVYDPYRDVYYRFIKMRYDDTSIQNMLMQKSGKPGKRSVMVIGSDFKIKGEFLLDENKYTIDEFFIASTGLYILNKSENEDVKIFSLFQLD